MVLTSPSGDAGRDDPTRDPTSTDPGSWTIGRLLSTTARRVERSWNAHLSAWDLNHASHPVLLHLLAGPRSQRELAGLLGVTEQTMSRIIARLARTGLVTRAVRPDDRRRLEVALTPAGRGAALEASDTSSAERLVTDALTPDELARLHDLLVRIVRHQDEASGRPPRGR